MERINRLLHHPSFQENLTRLEQLEADRIYCCHGLSHLLDTARLACLLQYQNNESNSQQAAQKPKLSTEARANTPSTMCNIPNEVIYAAALLHDIGRVLQYEQGLPHETAGLAIAELILKDCGFTKSERLLILDAIQFHRRDTQTDIANASDNIISQTETLRTLLHTADKLSRNCFACHAADSCYWPEDKKNRGIVW